MAPSVAVLQKSDGRSTVGFSLWMKIVENKINLAGVKTVDVKNLMQEESGQGESKNKKLCMCSPTNHPGSFRCRYHRSTSTQKVKPVQPAARDNLKLKSMNAKPKPKPKPSPLSAGVKPPLYKFGKAHVVASELPR